MFVTTVCFVFLMVVLVFPICQNGWQAVSYTLTANFIYWENGSSIFMNFILVSTHAPENQTRLLLLFGNTLCSESLVLRPTSSSGITTSTIHFPPPPACTPIPTQILKDGGGGGGEGGINKLSLAALLHWHIMRKLLLNVFSALVNY